MELYIVHILENMDLYIPFLCWNSILSQEERKMIYIFRKYSRSQLKYYFKNTLTGLKTAFGNYIKIWE